MWVPLSVPNGPMFESPSVGRKEADTVQFQLREMGTFEGGGHRGGANCMDWRLELHQTLPQEPERW